MFNTIEDGIGKMEILVFPKTLEKDPEIWQEEKIVLIKGKLSDKDGEYKLLCEEVNLVNEIELQKFKKEGKRNNFGINSFNNNPKNTPKIEKTENITIHIIKNEAQKKLQAISALLKKAPRGNSKIFITTEGRTGKLEIPQRISHNKNFIVEIEKIVGKENLKIIN